MDLLGPVISVRSAMDATADENAAYKSAVYCVTMTYVRLNIEGKTIRQKNEENIVIRRLCPICILIWLMQIHKLCVA